LIREEIVTIWTAKLAAKTRGRFEEIGFLV
jgi:hypothetical protein